MGKIKSKEFFGKQGQLFPLSPAAISEKLYNLIAKAVEEKVGKEVGKITQASIKKVINAGEFKEIFFIKKKHCLNLPFVVLDIYFPASYEYGVAIISLQLPLYGDCGQMEKAIKEIVREAGLEEVCCFQNGIKLEVILSGENLPYQITPNPFPATNGRSRKLFVTKKELLSGLSRCLVE